MTQRAGPAWSGEAPRRGEWSTIRGRLLNDGLASAFLSSLNTDLTYSDSTLALISQLLREPPRRVFSDSVSVAFDCGASHVITQPEAWIVDTQDNTGEACLMSFSRIDAAYEPFEHDEAILKAERLDQAWVLRAGLYFSGFIPLVPDATDADDLRRKVESVESVEDLRALSSGSLDYFPCHPDDPALLAADPRFAYLIDTGAVFRSGATWIKVFSDGNGYTSATNGRIADPATLAEYQRDYEWLPVLPS